jgi:hypothetical protein
MPADGVVRNLSAQPCHLCSVASGVWNAGLVVAVNVPLSPERTSRPAVKPADEVLRASSTRS